MALPQILLFVAVGFLSGGTNAIVGGGTFFSFPVLLAAGLPPIAANATSTVALWPASLTAARAYVEELRTVRERLLLRSLIAVAGGTVGAFLLLASGDALFYILIPWLIALATVLFAFSRPIVRRVSKFGSRANTVLTLVLAFFFGIYGGYFGAGVGVLLMAALALSGENDAQVANAQKNLLASCINGAAVLIFVVKGAVLWPVALTVMAGAVAGGYVGARAAKLIPGEWLRACVIAAGCVLSVIYFHAA